MTLHYRIAVFNQGVVEQIGAPMALHQRPANQFVANFIGAPRINPVDRPGTGAPAAHQAPWTALLGGSAAAAAARGWAWRPTRPGPCAPTAPVGGCHESAARFKNE